jgi:hypothetical protein
VIAWLVLYCAFINPAHTIALKLATASAQFDSGIQFAGGGPKENKRCSRAKPTSRMTETGIPVTVGRPEGTLRSSRGEPGKNGGEALHWGTSFRAEPRPAGRRSPSRPRSAGGSAANMLKKSNVAKSYSTIPEERRSRVPSAA